jgi:hypothetical protein
MEQRKGSLERTILSRPDGMLRLLENSFAELGRRDLWSSVFHVNWRIASTVPLAQLAVPNGLDLLAHAVRAYSRTVT